jgi:hypothetical protein
MAATIEEIRAELKAINRRMWRARDSNDRNGMLRLKARIVQLKSDIEQLRATPLPRFRRSYAFDQFIELLATGRKKDHARA